MWVIPWDCSGIVAPEKVAHRACLSVLLKMPNRQFPGHLADHMPPRLHVLLHVMGPLCSLVGAGETSLWLCSPGGVGILSHAAGY